MPQLGSITNFGKRSAYVRKAFSSSRHRCVFVAVLLLISLLQTLGDCKLPKGNVNKLMLRTLSNGSVTASSCGFWALTQSAIDNDDTCYSSESPSGDGYLLFQFWRFVNRTGGMTPRSIHQILFMVNRGVQPMAYVYGDEIAITPNPSAQDPQLGPPGTWMDDVGFSTGRSYQRVLVPMNASRGGPQDWYVTVFNLDVQGATDYYAINVSCVLMNSQEVPCPQPAPDQPECGGPDRGTCGDPPSVVSERRSLNRICYCEPGWGDFDCQTPAPQLQNGDTASAVLAPGEWAFWQISVPLPANVFGTGSTGSSAPALLVEMNRAGAGAFAATDGLLQTAAPATTAATTTYGGDPLLFLMPKYGKDGHRMPYLSDSPNYTDRASFRLQQNLHFILERQLTDAAMPAASATSSGQGRAKAAEYYIAVYNNDISSSRLPGGMPLLNPNANVSLRVRWRIGSGEDVFGAAGLPPSSLSPLCPGDCYNRGRCSDPYSPRDVIVGLNPGPIPATRDFLCTCDNGYGGPLCEGTLKNLTLSTGGNGGNGILEQGQWAFFVVYVDPSRFDVDSDELTVQWKVAPTDNNSNNPTANYQISASYNALLGINLMAFPRLPLSWDTSAEPFTRGQWLPYDWLFKGDGKWKPIRISGGELKEGYSYVLGLYNSDYVRQAPYNYALNVYIPTYSRTWLPPYMSVVLGVSASITLCLIMTACRQLLQRYGWGPFRPGGAFVAGILTEGAAVGPDDNVTRVQVAQIVHRLRGVPADIIDGFYSYEYRATRAEKAQPAKRGSELQQQPGLQQQPAVQTTQGQEQEQVQQQEQEHQAEQQLGQKTATAGGGGGEEAVAVFQLEKAVGSRAVSRRNQFVSYPAATAAATTIAGIAATAAVPSSSASISVWPSTSGGGGGSATSAVSDGDSDEGRQCAVCLCEYEEGENITQLPCKHEFHGKCIRMWLQTHYTCPVCRELLLPENPHPHLAGEPRTTQGPAPGTGPDHQQQQRQQQRQQLPPQSPGQPRALSAPMSGVPVAAAGGGDADRSGHAGVTMSGVLLPPTASAPVAATQTSAEAAASPLDAQMSRPGLLARVFGSLRRSSSSTVRQGVSLQPVEQLQPAQSSPQYLQLQQRSSEPWAERAASPASGAASLAPYQSYPPQPDPVSAGLFPPTNSMDRDGTAAGGAIFMGIPPSPGSPQLTARGPTATLDSYPQRQSRSAAFAAPATAAVPPIHTPLVPIDCPPVAAAASAGGSPTRLAAGRQQSPPATAAAASPSLLQLGSSDAVLPSQLVDEGPFASPVNFLQPQTSVGPRQRSQ